MGTMREAIIATMASAMTWDAVPPSRQPQPPSELKSRARKRRNAKRKTARAARKRNRR